MELGLSVKKLAWSLEYDKNIMHAAELGLKARFLAPRDCFSSPTAFSGERSLAPWGGRGLVLCISSPRRRILLPAPRSPCGYVPFIPADHYQAFLESSTLYKSSIPIASFDPHNINLDELLLLPPLQMRIQGTREIK